MYALSFNAKMIFYIFCHQVKLNFQKDVTLGSPMPLTHCHDLGNLHSRLETNLGDGQRWADFKMGVATTHLWLKFPNLEDELILLEFEKFILSVA